ncbi:hypothetical protein TREMEDRAFT_59217 [Tremella mesenterica DSM 1558]|uniref:uncharacterized protein n=1 Tax=Tremella mesenterica (strain ATCC 24925 / CBS 8224 / DSM 1558 / NBRC 9311 / NRRL Y-6157 / RJB 2259-6 / UBC 559-6) TaxID=578456 RepID=UPI0003F48E7A|nr:uncharacterized protein TREMEDRAFT_59217 [Tremella mesenterica DSM 1558]EIW73054.1 hypothetical protein TREMEDRAFT_59217 [Tremella mesenterica DSM 1558]
MLAGVFLFILPLMVVAAPAPSVTIPPTDYNAFKTVIQFPAHADPIAFEKAFIAECIKEAKVSQDYYIESKWYWQKGAGGKNLLTQATCYCINFLKTGVWDELTYSVAGDLGAAIVLPDD